MLNLKELTSLLLDKQTEIEVQPGQLLNVVIVIRNPIKNFFAKIKTTHEIAYVLCEAINNKRAKILNNLVNEQPFNRQLHIQFGENYEAPVFKRKSVV